MNGAIILVLAIAAIVLLTGAFMAGGSPRFWWDLATIVLDEGLPKLKLAWEAYKATKTPEEWRKLREDQARWNRGDR